MLIHQLIDEIMTHYAEGIAYWICLTWGIIICFKIIMGKNKFNLLTYIEPIVVYSITMLSISAYRAGNTETIVILFGMYVVVKICIISNIRPFKKLIQR